MVFTFRATLLRAYNVGFTFATAIEFFLLKQVYTSRKSESDSRQVNNRNIVTSDRSGRGVCGQQTLRKEKVGWTAAVGYGPTWYTVLFCENPKCEYARVWVCLPGCVSACVPERFVWFWSCEITRQDATAPTWSIKQHWQEGKWQAAPVFSHQILSSETGGSGGSHSAWAPCPILLALFSYFVFP